MPFEFTAKKGFTTPLNASVSGSLTVLGATILQGISGSFTGSHVGNTVGTASWAQSSISSSYATSASWAPPVTSISASYATTSSHSNNAENAYAINFIPSVAVSASWVSASNRITTADTASYVAGANVVGAVSLATLATTATTANAISFIPSVTISASWVSASNLINTASYANNAENAYAINFIPSVSVSASWVSASNLINTASYSTTSSFSLKASSSLTSSYFNSQPSASHAWQMYMDVTTGNLITIFV